MPTYPVVNVAGDLVRLTAPQWTFLRQLAQALERRPTVEYWLLHEVLVEHRSLGPLYQRLGKLVERGVIESTRKGFRLPVRVRAQVASYKAG